MPQTNKEIAASIRALAKARGVTIKQTLTDCRINRNFIYDLEHGKTARWSRRRDPGAARAV